jgi:hypothetical protein
MKLDQLVKIRKEMFNNIKPTKMESKSVDLAAYPWDECVADQTERYGDEETAKKVCGAIKAMYGRKEEMNIEPNPCWEGYEPIGLKDDGSPNCVPIKAKKEKMDVVKQGFPIPSPESGESEQDYVSRCMKEIGSEYDTQEQALAICYAQLEKK